MAGWMRRGAPSSIDGCCCAEPCRKFHGRQSAPGLMLSELDPERFAATPSSSQAYDRLLDLVETRPRDRISTAARALGLRFPPISWR
jgi:hypothetical protein